MKQKKMIVYQFIKQVKVSRGYEIDIVFDLNYEQFLQILQYLTIITQILEYKQTVVS